MKENRRFHPLVETKREARRVERFYVFERAGEFADRSKPRVI